MIIVNDFEQGSEEWALARCGIPTASEFSRIVTNTGKKSTQASAYMDKLLAEWLLGKPVVSWEGNSHSEHGHEYEEQARSWYEFRRDADVDHVGIVYKDDSRLIAASPDGLIDSDGGCEIKCPSPGWHVHYLLNGMPTKYYAQVQGGLWVCEREWWEWVSFHPEMPEQVLVRVPRDEEYIKTLANEISAFVDAMLEKRERLSSITS